MKVMFYVLKRGGNILSRHTYEKLGLVSPDFPKIGEHLDGGGGGGGGVLGPSGNLPTNPTARVVEHATDERDNRKKVALKAPKAVVEVDDYEALSENEEYQQSIPASEDFPAADPSGGDGPVAEGDGPVAEGDCPVADTSVLTENGKRRMTHQQGSMEKRRIS